MTNPRLAGLCDEIYKGLMQSGLLPMRPYPLVANEVNMLIMTPRMRGNVELTLEAPGVPFVVCIHENGYAELETVRDAVVDDNYLVTLNSLKYMIDFHNSMVS